MTNNIIKILGGLGTSDSPKIIERHQEEPFYNNISAYVLVEKDGNSSCYYYYSGQKLNRVTDLMNPDIRGLR